MSRLGRFASLIAAAGVSIGFAAGSSPLADEAFITNQNANSVSVLDLMTNERVTFTAGVPTVWHVTSCAAS